MSAAGVTSPQSRQTLRNTFIPAHKAPGSRIDGVAFAGIIVRVPVVVKQPVGFDKRGWRRRLLRVNFPEYPDLPATARYFLRHFHLPRKKFFRSGLQRPRFLPFRPRRGNKKHFGRITAKIYQEKKFYINIFVVRLILMVSVLQNRFTCPYPPIYITYYCHE